MAGEPEDTLAARTAAIITSDALRMRCLTAARGLGLPDWYIAAGFVRNAIWDAQHSDAQHGDAQHSDAQHEYVSPTPLNDVDLVYYDRRDASPGRDDALVQALSMAVPEVCWDVKNQARMHRKHGHAPYRDSEDAIAHWIEMPTCVGVQLTMDDRLRVVAPFGLACCFSLRVEINPRYPRPQVFMQRLRAKQWQQDWPKLRFTHCQGE